MSKRIEQLLEQLLAAGRNSLSLVSTSVVDANANTAIGVTAASSAVNYLSTTNAASGASPILGVAGASTNISLRLQDKGAGSVLCEAPFLSLNAVASITTAGNASYSAANVLGGYIIRDCAGSGRSDSLPAAATLISAIPGATANMGLWLVIKNDSDAAETISLTAGTGNTIVGGSTIAQNNTRLYRVVLTNVGSGTESVSYYSVMGGTH